MGIGHGVRNALIACTLTGAATVAGADGHDHRAEPHYLRHGPHHVSMMFGGTDSDEFDTEYTFALDYDYRFNARASLGAVVQHATGDLDATTLLGIADVRVWDGLTVRLGPGVEFNDDDDVFVFRVGGLYEIEFDTYTMAPQIHYDIHDGAEDTIVFGLAVGRSF